MREIGFRAWSNEHNRYCDFVTLDENGRWVGWIKSSGVYLTTADIVLEQDTGLKNKNGTKIHEGDIVGFYEYYLNEETGEDEPGGLEPWGQVIYEDTKARFGVWGDSPYADEEKHFFGLTEILEVIGNIHENQDLLGDTNVTNKEEG